MMNASMSILKDSATWIVEMMNKERIYVAYSAAEGLDLSPYVLSFGFVGALFVKADTGVAGTEIRAGRNRIR